MEHLGMYYLSSARRPLLRASVAKSPILLGRVLGLNINELPVVVDQQGGMVVLVGGSSPLTQGGRRGCATLV